MSRPFRDERAFMTHLLDFTGWRTAAVLASMVAVALSEGLGLLLLIPLLSLVDIGASQETGGVLAAITDYMTRLNVEMTLGTVIVAFLAIVAVRQGMVYVSRRLIEDTRVSYVNALRKDLFAAIGKTRWRALRSGDFAELGQVLLMDGWRAGDAALNVFRGISTGIIILANAAVAFLIAPMLSLFALIGIGILMLVFGSRFQAARIRGGRVSSVQNEVYTVVDNYLDNLRVAKLAAAENRLEGQFERTIEGLGSEMRGYYRSTIAVSAILQLAAAIGIAGFIAVAVSLFGVTGPELLVIVFITARLVPHFTALNQALHHFTYHLPAFSKAMAAIDRCRENQEQALTEEWLPVPDDTIALRDITLRAVDEPDKMLLTNVTLQVRVGEVAALEGPSGAGKSTLADILSGLVDADSGSLMLDGEALTPGQRVQWRQHVGYVPQSAVLLRGTLRENLTWLLPYVPADDDLRRILSCVELTSLIEVLPAGIDTRVDSREGKLSGGERQRIALARELLRQPALLILDEATNALDLDTEARVIRNIREFRPGMTMLIIAHRPETLGFADRVLRMRDGRLIVSGNERLQEIQSA